MALTVTVPLTDEQSVFVRQMADEINPGMTDQELEQFLGNRFKEFLVGWVSKQADSQQGPLLEQAKIQVAEKVKATKRQAHLLFIGGA